MRNTEEAKSASIRIRNIEPGNVTSAHQTSPSNLKPNISFENLDDISQLHAYQQLSDHTLDLQVEKQSKCDTQEQSQKDYFLFKSEKKVLLTTISTILFVLLVVVNSKGLVILTAAFLKWVKALGMWGNLMFCVMFLLISFPFVLGGYTPLTLGAGALYGVIMGTITVSISSTFGACVAFYACRAVGRKWLETKLKDATEFKTFQIMFQSRERKLISFLARLSPIPFGLQNSFFALTDISFWDFLLSTWIGLLPFQILWTHFGTTLRNLSKIGTGQVHFDFWQKVSLVFQLAMTFGLLIYFWHLSKKFTAAAKAENDSDQEAESDALPRTDSTVLTPPVPITKSTQKQRLSISSDLEMGHVKHNVQSM